MILLWLALAAAETETYLFTDWRYANMTLDAAHATYRLARRDPRAYEHHFLVTIYVLDETPCAHFAPFFCIATRTTGRDYFSLIARRMTVLLASLEFATRIDGILMLDSDVHLRRNIAPRMARYNTSLVFQRELPCSTRVCANGGVWWARANDEGALRVVRHAHRLMRTLQLPDQDALGAALAAHPKVTVAYLPVESYPNGFAYAANERRETRRVHLVHTNWCSFDDKRARLAALAETRAHYLPVPRNRTDLCAALGSLDPLNLATVMGCTRCQLRLEKFCKP